MSPDAATAEPALDESPAASLFGIRIHPVRMAHAVDRVFEWFRREGSCCRYVVTPNVNHVVALESNADLQQAYQSASLVLADGWPVVASARLCGVALPERVAGSDLVPRVFDAAEQRGEELKVFLLGGMPGVAERAAERIHDRWPTVHVAGVDSPPLGFEKDPEELAKIIERINASEPDFLVVGFGAPKQEIWLSRFHDQLRAKVAVAAGATIDFLAGEQTRAPRAIQRLGLEWLFRIGTNPKRLAGRYLRDATVFPRLVLREMVQRRAPHDQC